VGILQERALRRVHAGDAKPYRKLEIDGQDYTDILDSASADFDPRSSGSSMQFQVRDSLEGLEDSRVVLKLGYGELAIPYFAGNLQEPSQLKSGKGAAYGPFKLMAEQSFGEPVTYPSGATLGHVFRDLGRRAAYPNGVLSVIGAEDTEIERLDYTEETMLLEAAKAVSEPAKFVFFDGPGYKRTVMPEPKPGAGKKSSAHYTESNYPPGAFTTTETREGHFAKVVVFRRNDLGGYDVRAEVPVPNRGRIAPPENRIFYVPEYPGNATEAKQEAYETANRLAYGQKDFGLSGIWINPELGLFDSITVEATERRGRKTRNGRPGKWLVTYRCLISSGLSVSVAKEKHHMDLSGGAVQIQEIKLRDPIRLSLRSLSTGLIVAAVEEPPPSEDEFTYWGQTNITWDSEAMDVPYSELD